MISKDTAEQITTQVMNGLARPSIEAMLGRPLDDEETQLYKKTRAYYNLQLREKRVNRKYQHLSGAEVKRKHDDKIASIDETLDAAISEIDWKRRKECEQDIVKWVNTYCVGTLLDDSPPPEGEKVLRNMYRSIIQHKNFMICQPRGSGKSCYVLCVTLFAISTGLHDFIVIVSNNARASGGLLNDLWRAVYATDTTFAHDYPTVTLPFTLCNGSFRRKQLYHGHTTNLQKNSSNIVFPTLYDKQGKKYATSDAIVTVRGITSGIRGLKHGTKRPTLVILDDLQSTETAENAEQVDKMITAINKDIIPLAGKQRLSILQTATPICTDDLVDRLQHDKSWQTTLYPAIIKYPDKMDLWDEYLKIFDAESVELTDHSRSLKYYETHRIEMDEGAVLFNPTRFCREDGHISALQKLLELKHTIGEAAFASEYQMKPQKLSFALDISPNDIVSKQIDVTEDIVPDGYQMVVASSDLNLSFCISTTILAFKVDGTAHVLKHIFRKSRIGGRVADAEYNRKVYDLLTEHGKEIKALNLPIKAWAIDCNGLPFDAVTSFCNNSMSLCGLFACGFIGKASHMFNPNVKSRIRSEIGRTVLCGDDLEHLKAGAGKKYVFWDSDHYREKVQNAFLSPLGCQGCLTLYRGMSGCHTDYAIQVCAEKLKLKRHRQDGRWEYYWKSANDHDMLDSTAQAYACAAQMGITSQNFDGKKHTIHRPKKKIIRIV